MLAKQTSTCLICKDTSSHARGQSRRRVGRSARRGAARPAISGKDDAGPRGRGRRPSVDLEVESPADRARLADPEQFLAAHVDKLVFLDELAAGDSHACAALRVGSVERWGDDTSGQAPPFLALSNVVTIAAGFAHSRAVLRDGSFTCWGLNRFGQLGD
ncbi:MAG: hypothetical protein FJ137_11345 [Deltaproteobacteria bacterium]|nr:hypothetical protein [Deltaproteobacteria bacterium]